MELYVEETPDDGSWMLEARCRGTDPDEFFPTGGSGVEAAKRVCAECPVRSECLEYALVNRIDPGVWGGASSRERRRILRKRRKAEEKLAARGGAEVRESETAHTM